MSRLTKPDKYVVSVVNAYLTDSKEGKPGIAINFECPQGTIDCIRWATPAAAQRTWEDLEVLGFTAKHAEDMDNLDKLTEIIGGHSCQIVCENEEYQGTETLKVKWINPVGGMKSTNPQTKKQAFENLRDAMSGNSITRGAAPVRPDGLTSGPRPATTSPAPFAPVTKTDVPF